MGSRGGAKTGLFIDELYDGDILYLYELKKCLADAAVHFEAVVIDACMMANIETACVLKNNANWMVASEEEVPGKGTAIEGWLQELFNNPGCDGCELGRRKSGSSGRSFLGRGREPVVT